MVVPVQQPYPQSYVVPPYDPIAQQIPSQVLGNPGATSLPPVYQNYPSTGYPPTIPNTPGSHPPVIGTPPGPIGIHNPFPRPRYPQYPFRPTVFPVSFFDARGIPQTIVLTLVRGRLRRRKLRKGIFYPSYAIGKDQCNHTYVPACGDCQGRFGHGQQPDATCRQTCAYATGCANVYHIGGSIIEGLRASNPWLRLG